MGKEKMSWDGAADQKLLLTVLATHDIKVDFEAVAASFGSHCTPRAVQERIKKLKIMAKNDHVPSPASSPSKASSAAAKKAAVPKVKANTKSKVTKDDMQALKKRKANNSGLAVANIDSDEGSLTEGEAAANQTNSHSRAINEVETTEPSLANKRKIDEMLVFHEDKDSHNGIKVEEPFNFDGDLSNISAICEASSNKDNPVKTAAESKGGSGGKRKRVVVEDDDNGADLSDGAKLIFKKED